MTQIWVWTLVFYIVALPLSIVGLNQLYKYLFITKRMDRARKKKQNPSKLNLPDPPLGRWMERFNFTMKDKRPLTFGSSEDGSPRFQGPQRRFVAFGLYVIGLAVSALPFVLSDKWLTTVGISALIFYIFFIFAVKNADKVIKTRNRVIDRMYSIGRSKLQIPADMPAKQAVRVTEWRDVVKPNKAEIYVPDEFGEEGQEGFQKQFNQIFGRETAWVPDNIAPTKENPDGQLGWDYDEQVVRLRAVPPLPRMAKWDEHYVLDENIAWSFFPIALGVEDGVELTNPETGEVEHVLGFDLSGEQTKMKGVTTSPTITTSPMCLTGDTLLKTSEGLKKISELSEIGEAEVLSWNKETSEYEYRRMFGIQKTRENSDIVEVFLRNGGSFRCTPDHRMLTETKDGETYVQAISLTSGTVIKGLDEVFERIVERVEVLDYREDVYDGEVEVNHNFVIGVNTVDDTGEINHQSFLLSSNCYIGGGTGGGKSLSGDTLITVLDED